MRVKDAVGRFGEEVACRYLDELGIAVIERNWRCSQGEIDIVALDGRTLVVVEVKTRSTMAFGLPAEAVTPAKAARLRRLAGRWIAEHRASAEQLGWREVRIDVVSVLRRGQGLPDVEHYRDAV